MSTPRSSVEVDGGASAEEIAAVLAALAGRRAVTGSASAAGSPAAGSPAGGYAAWRRGRLDALARAHPGKPMTAR